MLGIAGSALAGVAAFTVAAVLQNGAPPAKAPPKAPATPSAPPAKNPTPREKIQPPQDQYKPTRQAARQEGVDDPAPAESAENTTPAQPAPATVAPTTPIEPVVPEPAAPVAPAQAVAATPALPVVAAPAPIAMKNADILVLGVLALIVLLPLVLGVWWILLSRGEDRSAATEEA